MEIRIKEGCITEKGKKLLNGWEHWSLEDVNRTLDVLKELAHRSAASYVGHITFNVLLKAANYKSSGKQEVIILIENFNISGCLKFCFLGEF